MTSDIRVEPYLILEIYYLLFYNNDSDYQNLLLMRFKKIKSLENLTMRDWEHLNMFKG